MHGGQTKTERTNKMKRKMNINKLAVAVALGLAVCATAIAQGRPAGAGGGVAHLTEGYARVVPFDSNNDGVLNKAEQATLITAIASGTVKAPFRTGRPEGVNPSAEQIVARIAAAYAVVAPYDADADRKLDADEKAAIQLDITRGILRRPGAPQP